MKQDMNWFVVGRHRRASIGGGIVGGVMAVSADRPHISNPSQPTHHTHQDTAFDLHYVHEAHPTETEREQEEKKDYLENLKSRWRKKIEKKRERQVL
jgi:hypothetical protein